MWRRITGGGPACRSLYYISKYETCLLPVMLLLGRHLSFSTCLVYLYHLWGGNFNVENSRGCLQFKGLGRF